MKRIHTFAKQHEREMVRFTKGQRKDEVTLARLKGFHHTEGVLHRCSPGKVSLIFDRRITKRAPGRLPQGFRNATLRTHGAQLMGELPSEYKPGAYDLRMAQ